MSELDVGSDPEDTQSLKSLNVSTTSLLDQFVSHVRESLGIESHLSASRYIPGISPGHGMVGSASFEWYNWEKREKNRILLLI